MSELRRRKKTLHNSNEQNLSEKIEKTSNFVSNMVNAFIKKHRRNPLFIVVVVVAISIATHYLVHNMGLISASRNLGSDKANIHRAVGKIPFLGAILRPLNKYLNMLVKKGGIFAQPALIIGLKRFIQSVGTNGFLNAIEHLEMVVRSLSTSATGSMLYYYLFSRHGVFANSPFDPSGHSLLGHINVLNMSDVESLDNIEIAIKNVWTVCYLISAATTIIFYHTVPEYLVGMLMAYVGYYTWGYFYNIAFRQLFKLFPNNESVTDYKRMIDRVMKRKEKTAGGYIINPKTGRFVKSNGKIGKSILKNGIIKN